LEGGHRNVVSVHLEKFTQLLAEIGSSESVRSEHLVAALYEWADLIGERPHVVSGGDGRATAPIEALLYVGLALWLFWMEHVPALHLDAFTAQLGEAWATPDIRNHAEVFLQQFRRGNNFAKDGTAAQELHPRRFLVGGTFGEQ